MKRGYTQQEYRDLVAKIRSQIPDSSIATDVIVGFPGETEEQFMETYRLLSDLKLDVAHLARYSLREGTLATRRLEDNIPEEEKIKSGLFPGGIRLSLCLEDWHDIIADLEILGPGNNLAAKRRKKFVQGVSPGKVCVP